MNNKALTSIQGIIIIIAIVIVAVLIAAVLSATPAATEQPVTVTIDGETQTNNYTQPQVLTWDNAIAGWTYSKNFTVTNNTPENVTVTLIAVAPAGASLTWDLNNTALAPSASASAPLQVTSYVVGSYSWKLATSNLPPTATPTATEPTQQKYTCTIKIDPASDAITTLNVTVGGSKIPLYPEDIDASGYIVNFTSSETLRFQVGADSGYVFVRWDLSNHNPTTDNPLILSNIHEDFVITAKLVPPQEPA